MKIRTDFVTNSSSSSFITAMIHVTDDELLASVKKVIKKCGSSCRVNNNVIYLDHYETDFGFRDHGQDPAGIIDALLALLEDFGNSEDSDTLKKRKTELADSIVEYEITLGEEGNSENEWLWDSYVTLVSKETGIDWDDVNEELCNTEEWVRETTTISYKQGESVEKDSYLSGPFDDFDSFKEEMSNRENIAGTGVFEIENHCLKKYCGKDRHVTIPDGVTGIGEEAFSGCSRLQSITIPNGVTSIGDCTFSGCRGLQSITIPDSVTSIGRGAFSGCYKFQSITIPDGVTSIGDGAFSDCYKLQSITIPDGVTRIGDYTFRGCSRLQSITIPDSVTSIGGGAFSDCHSLQSITIPNRVTNIVKEAFKDCSGLQSITIPNRVTRIGKEAFKGCSGLQSITIPDGVTSIGNYAFSGCRGLQSITIPDGVTSIGNYAFSGCRSLQSITIPDGVTSIDSAFYECPRLQMVIAPHLELTNFPNKCAAMLGYWTKRELFTDDSIAADTYKKYANSQRKKLLPEIFKLDLVAALQYYAETKKITKANYQEEYLAPAQAANAEKCVAFLLEWDKK